MVYISRPQRLTDQRQALRCLRSNGGSSILCPADNSVASPEPRRNLAVVPLIADQRYYGEATARLRRCSREGRARDGRNSFAAGQGEDTRFFSSLVGAAAEAHLDPKNRSRAPAIAGP